MGGALFWGTIVIVIGASIILNGVFKINIPIFKILFGLLFVFIGLKIIFGSWQGVSGSRCGDHDVVFHEQTINQLDEDKKEYNAIFGKMTLDLRDMQIETSRTIEVHTVFAATEIFLNKELPVKIITNVVFGGANLPDRTSGGFGSTTYSSKNLDENAPYLIIKADTVFGGLDVRH